MVPQNIMLVDGLRIEELPAQEQMVLPEESYRVLTAEQVYTQRFIEFTQNSDLHTQGFIP
ncbi:MAG: hypothetical protein WCK35_20755 [Chloroflexota bacterium]